MEEDQEPRLQLEVGPLNNKAGEVEGALSGGDCFGRRLGVDGCGHRRGKDFGGDVSGCLGGKLAGSSCNNNNGGGKM